MKVVLVASNSVYMAELERSFTLDGHIVVAKFISSEDIIKNVQSLDYDYVIISQDLLNNEPINQSIEAMKNINAFDQVRAAIEYEIKRQTEVLESGEKVVQETRRIADDGKTYPMRKKVDAIDYKYYIEPNLAPVKLTDEYLEEIRKTVPVLKLDREEMYMEKYNLSLYDASVLAKNRKIADYFEEVLEYGSDVLLTVNFVTTAVLSSLKKLEISIDQFFITPKMLSGVIDLVYAKKISLDNAKKILYQAIEKKKDPLEIINESNISQISDDSKLLEFIKEAIDENPDQVRQYVEEGKDYVVNYFIGKVMQKSNRQANPNRSLELIKIELEKRKN